MALLPLPALARSCQPLLVRQLIRPVFRCQEVVVGWFEEPLLCEDIPRIEYMPWVAGAFAEPAEIKNGRMLPPQKPGLGLEIPEEIVRRFRVE